MTAPVPTVSDAPLADAPAPTVPAVPDRADAPVSEVAERFLKAVIAEVPLDLIEELHLFSPLRQGTVETGIAVLAARVPEPEVDAATREQAEQGEPELFEPTASDTDAPEVDAEAADAGEAEAQEAVPAPEEHEEAHPRGDDAIVLDEVIAHDVRVVAAEGDDDEDVSFADEADVVVSAAEEDEAVVVALEAASADDTAVPAPKPVRHTVYTARYRYVIKGPERGKWESSVKAEADAPLVTVETVVRGVQRRAGEESEIVRYTAAQIARALRVPFPA